MEKYLEQVVPAQADSGKRLLYILMQTLFVLFMLCALISFAALLTGLMGSFDLNWIAMAGALVFGGLSVLLRQKRDALRTEYEYVYNDGRIEISCVLNNRRRKRLATLDLGQVVSCGDARGPEYEKCLRDQGAKLRRWYTDDTAALYYFYEKDHGLRYLAILQLNDDMAHMIARSTRLNRGAWHDTEGKTTYNASIS